MYRHFKCAFVDHEFCLIFLPRRIDEQEAEYIKRLSESVAIQSVSAWPEKRPEIKRQIEWAGKVICN